MSDFIRVVLVDDHPVVRHGLVAVIDAEDDIEVVGEAGNGREAIDLVEELNPDVVLMDLQMPVMNGVEAIKQINTQTGDTRIIILTTFADDDHIYDGIVAGARGYLLKDAPANCLVEAVRAASRGESLLNPEVAARILERFTHMIDQPAGASPQQKSAGNPKKTNDSPKLTPRELDVLRLMSLGSRNRDIAEALMIAERTVKIHVSNILGKLNVSNRTEAVAIAVRRGLINSSQ
ncbi:MAG: response regulator transcription factor [Anaerolineae bacterium]|nr:response regulator transcription factor [Anaerolineae bacterium]